MSTIRYDTLTGFGTIFRIKLDLHPERPGPADTHTSSMIYVGCGFWSSDIEHLDTQIHEEGK